MEGVGCGKLDEDIAFKNGALLKAGVREMERDVEFIRIDGDETELAMIELPAAGEIQKLRIGDGIRAGSGGSKNANAVGERGGRGENGQDEFAGRELREGGGELVSAAIDGVPKRGDGAEAFLGVEFGLPVLSGRFVFECGEHLKRVGRNKLQTGFLISVEPDREGDGQNGEQEDETEPGAGRWLSGWHGESVSGRMEIMNFEIRGGM